MARILKVLRKQRILQLIKIWCEIGPEFAKVLRKAPSSVKRAQTCKRFVNVDLGIGGT